MKFAEHVSNDKVRVETSSLHNKEKRLGEFVTHKS